MRKSIRFHEEEGYIADEEGLSGSVREEGYIADEEGLSGSVREEGYIADEEGYIAVEEEYQVP